MPAIDLTALIAAVDENETVDNSAIALITNIGTLIAEAVAADDRADEATNAIVQAAIADVTAKLTASSAKVTAALLANTPSQP